MKLASERASSTMKLARSGTFAVASGALGGLKDSILEVKDSVVTRQEAPPELIAAETPADRWFTPKAGWPREVASFPEAETCVRAASIM